MVGGMKCAGGRIVCDMKCEVYKLQTLLHSQLKKR